ncbi:conserved hypothetical protein [Theileria orientalis strain Shintoku]|uniref:Uncharacterized protein n=1 Tax=Theileria orientalis strain Shintoku TaxID=869250 RepID=J4C8W2_THEOR|nr:conserved hypothetical protein [Theileria orientalis strain Shintoku]BAM41483.1 conserved hypothetical protein [Theileria orientalis strain Shintoku]|eukprot:XP_009691784.1 conserved hypothetical protein [Theileria orientalis strain Shintoku]
MLLGHLMAYVCVVNGFRVCNNQSTSNLILNSSSNIVSGLNSTNGAINYDYLSRLHNEAFESPQFQLHIPPISDSLPVLNKELTKSSVYSNVVGESGGNQNTDGTTVPRNSEDSTSLGIDKQSSDDDYLDGPLDVLEMVKSGLIPEYRTPSSTSKGSQSANSRTNQLFSCRFERPADVFLLNFSTVDLGHREYIYTSCKVLSKLDVFKDDVKVKQVLDRVFANQIPVWLSTCFNYSFPHGIGIAEYVLMVYYYIDRYRDSTTANIDAYGGLDGSSEYSKVDNWEVALNKLIRNGNPHELVDYLSDERYRLNLTGNELQNWRVDGLYDELLKYFKGVDIEKVFMDERNQLKENHKLYNELVKYRKKRHISYNKTLVQLINYYIQYLKMPLYIVTDTEDVDEVNLRLKMFGVKSNELLNVLKTCNYSTGESKNKSRNEGDSDGKQAEERNVEGFLSLMKLNPLIPIHYFDNSIHNLKQMLSNPKFEDVRLYFVDWGRSSYDHKLEALYTDKIKYIKNTSGLVEFICKFNTFYSREWTHGYRLRYPNEEEQAFLLNWKEKWHKPVDTTISKEGRMLPNI